MNMNIITYYTVKTSNYARTSYIMKMTFLYNLQNSSILRALVLKMRAEATIGKHGKSIEIRDIMLISVLFCNMHTR